MVFVVNREGNDIDIGIVELREELLKAGELRVATGAP